MYLIVLSKVVAAIPFLGNGVIGRMATAPHFSIVKEKMTVHFVS